MNLNISRDFSEIFNEILLELITGFVIQLKVTII